MNVPVGVKELAMGLRHMLILSNQGTVFAAGSNELGQLGIQNTALTKYYESPLKMDRTYYQASPIQIKFFSSNSRSRKQDAELSSFLTY